MMNRLKIPTRKALAPAALVLLVFLTMTATLAAASRAAPADRVVLELDEARQPVKLANWADVIDDPSGRLTFDQVLPQNASYQPGEIPQQLGSIPPARWYRFSVPPAPDSQRWYLRLPAAHLTQASLYTQQKNDQWEAQESGTRLPLSTWPVPHRDILLPIALNAEEPTKYLLRVQSGSPQPADIDFVNDRYLSAQSHNESVALGVAMGLLLMVCGWSLAHYRIVREPAYAWFSAWAFMSTATLASAVGLLRVHIWPELPMLEISSARMLPLLATSAGLLFLSYGMGLSYRARASDRLLKVSALSGVIAAAATNFLDAPQVQLLIAVALLAVLSCGLVAVLMAVRRVGVNARVLAIACGPAALAATSGGVYLLGGLPVQPREGAILMIVLVTGSLCLALTGLSVQVQRRLDQQRRIRAIEEVDPVTGLVNEDVFRRRLGRALTRIKDSAQYAEVALIDVGLREDGPHETTRSSMQLRMLVAHKLSGEARSGETVASLSGARFGVLFEGTPNPSRGANFGHRLLTQCLAAVDARGESGRLLPKIAVAVLPGASNDIETMLFRMNTRLDEANDSVRSVFLEADSPLT